MTAEASALLVAIVTPLAALAALVGLIAGVRELERSRDELIELDPTRR
jgi:HAMP domain-containing protein